ncbi:GGDEF domain-containing protein [Devosia sp. MC521]|uniref:GGDEF domain-containing protein n=1 Tax=Devosia sp. MC521 TaxID=2759954 RepID=UPI0015FC4209|nr:GGDEF domain-containing protein [Devosia sp. MC521]MBJ6987701.1 diguanylate cyclase [Devosia sp. MC521]QMW62379.1 diguanylate cyclase [Devosia sp. MC521]
MREMVLLMDRQITNFTFSLAGPATLSAFAVIFLVLYFQNRQHIHLLIFAATAGTFSLGMLTQIIDALNETETGLPANILYVIAGFLFCAGLAKRIGRQPPYRVMIPVVIILALQTWFFTYVNPNQLARIYLLNFSAGLILIITALTAMPARHAVFTEKLLFWSLLLFGLHFFPRTILTAGFGLQMEPDDFMISSYWFTLQLCLAAFGSAVAIAVLCACIYDTVNYMTDDRDRDRLTRVLSRRAFHQQSEEMLKQSTGLPSCLAIFDIDNFRRFNQRQGYEEGDRILADFGYVLARNIRRANLTGRFDGEEFLILLPRTKLAIGIDTLKAFKATLRDHNFCSDDDLGAMTISVGIVEIGVDETYTQALMRAQQALKSAEATGPDSLLAGTAPTAEQKESPALSGAFQA